MFQPQNIYFIFPVSVNDFSRDSFKELRQFSERYLHDPHNNAGLRLSFALWPWLEFQNSWGAKPVAQASLFQKRVFLPTESCAFRLRLSGRVVCSSAINHTILALRMSCCSRLYMQLWLVQLRSPRPETESPTGRGAERARTWQGIWRTANFYTQNV